MSEKIEFEPLVFHTLEGIRKAMNIKADYFYRVLDSRENLYRSISIPKKHSGMRTLRVPELALKSMQRWILDYVLYPRSKNFISTNATGFVPTKSIVTNASVHLSKRYILKLDIEDFFPDINFGMIRHIFIKLGLKSNVATALTNICMLDNALPQGAPTSPFLANLVCGDLDKRIAKLCSKYNLDYTRYADDITISGDRNFFWIKSAVEEILNSGGFKINHRKTVFLKPGDRKRVTGIIVNEKLSVPKSVTRNLRRDIYFIKKYGLTNHMKKIDSPLYEREYVAQLYGIANFIKMVDINKGLIFIKELDELFRKKENIQVNAVFDEFKNTNEISFFWH